MEEAQAAPQAPQIQEQPVPASPLLAHESDSKKNKKEFLSRKGLLIVGIVIIVAGAGIFFVSKSQPTPPPPTLQATKAIPLFLTLESPKEGTAITNNTLTVSGKTLPNTVVAIFTDSDDTTVESDANGHFEGSITLSSGINTLTVTAYGDKDEEKTTTLDVVYDSE